MVFHNGNIEDYFLSADAPVCDAIATIEANKAKIALIVTPDRQLIGTLTDGDIRRAILNNISEKEPVQTLLGNKSHPDYQKPIVAPLNSTQEELAGIMTKYQITSIPLVNDAGQVADIAILQNFFADYKLPVRAVVMAGGFGTRLRPLTNSTPKPMLPVGEKPLLEQIINQLKASYINDVCITTHYLADQITDHFGDGFNHGVNINYLQEDQPLGTAGSVGMIHEPQETLLVINGDILTNLDFASFLQYHKQHKAALSVAVRRYKISVPYGVVESENGLITSIKEKPELSFFVNAGIYLLEPNAHALIPTNGEKFDMPDLVNLLLEKGETVANFPVHEYWLDIGKYDDYQKATQDMEKGLFPFKAPQ